MVRDLTEQKLLERQFQEAQKMEAVGRLAGSIAHDFNNLLTVVTGYSALLREGMSSNHPSLPRVEAIGRAAERAAQLTRGLLAFGRKQPVEPRVLNLNTVLGDMDGMLHSLVGEDVELLTILEDDLNNVEIDPAEVEQVVVNLATNARDAMPSGGRLTLETSNIAVVRNRTGPPRDDPSGFLRPVERHGYRRRHGRRNEVPCVRAVLHNKGKRQGDGPGPFDGLRNDPARRWNHPGPQRTRPGNGVQGLPARREQTDHHCSSGPRQI
jgi:hypothetical protein